MPATKLPSELTPSDRLMWKIERDPILRSPIVVVGLLDRDPEWHAVQATFERAVARVPRLRQVIRSAGLADRRLRWHDDPDFALGYHLRRVRAPHPGLFATVLELAAPSATASFDPARPPWECTLVEGLEGGRAAFILRFHHTITDGVGGVGLAGAVFDVDRRSGPPEPAPSPPPPSASPVDPPAGVVRWGVVRWGVVRSGVAAALHPAATLLGGLRIARSIGRMVEPAPAPLSPVFQDRGLDRRLDVLELPMDGLRTAAHAVGATINEVYLAAVAGGLHDYHQRLGHEVRALRVTMPISLRREGDPPGGNRFTPARFVLPIDDPDPAVRARLAGTITRRWRGEEAVGLTGVLAGVLDQLPTALVTPIFGSMLKNVDLDAVDVPGLEHEAFVGGARIDRLWAFAPPTGAALSVTLLSHVDTACVGVLSDLAAVDQPDVLLTCLESSFDEVLELGHRVAPALEEVPS